MNTNNPFDQNRLNSTPENTGTQGNETYSPHKQNQAGEQQSPTYGQVYTPDGHPQGNGYSSSSYSGAYSPYDNMQQGPRRETPHEPAPQKTKSNLAAIAVICCCALATVIVLGCIAFAMMSVSGIIGQNLIPGETDLETHQGLLPNTDEESLTPDSTENTPDTDEAPTVSKNPGQSTDVSGGKIGQLMTMSEAVALIKDSVVEINTEKMVTGSIYGQYIASGAGSGVIVAKEGYIITNNHVVEGAKAIKVTLTNGNKYDARLIGTDSATDIAVIKIDTNETLTTAVLGSSDKLVLAEDVIVIGNPLGSLGGTVTCGIISALDRQITVEGEKMTLLQTNAAVNPGNSGGGMFNLRGELVGIVNAKSTGEDVEGLGFAIPIDTAYTVFNQLVEYGYVRGRVDHGLNLVDINDWFMASSYRVNAFGVYVLESKYTKDIKNGDRIVSVNGIEVTTSTDITTALSDCQVGDTVKFVLVRQGKTVEASLTLKEYNPTSTGDVSFD